MSPNEYQKAALRTESVDVGSVIDRLLNLNKGTGEILLRALAKFEKEHDEEAHLCTTHIRLANGLMGLNGESGEAVDLFKKYLFQGHELDRWHIAKELGDIAWYLAVSADAIGCDLETIFEMNIDKLMKRYPGDGFDSEHSINRKDGDI